MWDKSYYLYRVLWWITPTLKWASQVVLVDKNPPANTGDARDAGSIPGLGRSPGVGNGTPLQDSCLENPVGRRAWQAIYSPWGCKESDTTAHRAHKMVLKIFAEIGGNRTLDTLQSQWPQSTSPLPHRSPHSDTGAAQQHWGNLDRFSSTDAQEAA